MTTDVKVNLNLSNEEAAEEVRIVVEKIVRYHPNPFHVTDKGKFFSAVDQLLEREGEIPVARQFFGLSRLTSLIFDTHTQIHITEHTPGFDVSFPLRFRNFSDGLYIVAGSEAYREIIGKRVVSIGGRQADEVLNTLAHCASSDNFPRKRVFAELFLYMPETYNIFDLTTPDGKIELLLQDLGGILSTTELSETWNKGYADFSWDRLNPFIPEELLTVHDLFGGSIPYYHQNLNDNYSYHFLDDACKWMYIQINKQFDKEEKNSIEFHLEWTQALWESKAERVIVDLRNVPGGMTNVGSGLPKFLENIFFTRKNMKGVAVLIGFDTVSAGTILAAELERAVWPVMIGNPTGSAPNMYLNPHKTLLPYSNLQLEVSTDIYISEYESDPRAYIAPDMPMALSFEEYANGRDPLLEAAKKVDRELMAAMYKGANHLAPWLRASQKEAYR